MTRKVCYCYTFRVPENPGYLSDAMWATWLMIVLLEISSYRYEPPPELTQAIQALSDTDRTELVQASGEYMPEFEEIHVEGTIVNVRLSYLHEWVRLFVTVEEG